MKRCRGDCEIDVHLPDVPAQVQVERLGRVARTCPIRRALETGFEFEERILRRPARGASADVADAAGGVSPSPSGLQAASTSSGSCPAARRPCSSAPITASSTATRAYGLFSAAISRHGASS